MKLDMRHGLGYKFAIEAVKPDWYEDTLQYEIKKLEGREVDTKIGVFLYEHNAEVVNVYIGQDTKIIEVVEAKDMDCFEQQKRFKITDDLLVQILGYLYREELLYRENETRELVDIKARSIYYLLERVAVLPYSEEIACMLISFIIKGIDDNEIDKKRNECKESRST